MSTYRAGYIEGKTKMSVYVSPEIHKALKLAAVERDESMGDIVERALRKELGMVALTWQVIEDNGGGLHLAVFEGKEVIYYNTGYEHNEVGLREDVAALENGDDPRGGWEIPTWIVVEGHDFQSLYDDLTSRDHGWVVVADQDGVYHDRMGAAAQRVFSIPWRELSLVGRENQPITDPEQVREALEAFRRTGAMNGVFFERLGLPHEDEEDASTWGPESPDHVDWTGFPEA